MIVSHIVATSENHVIGVQGDLPWHIPEDLKFFKDTTAHSVIVMGRKTYDSLGKPLPKRVNIVVSRTAQPQEFPEGVLLFNDVTEAVNTAKKMGKEKSLSEVFVVGGSEIYKQTLALNLVDRIYLTLIHTTVENGDAFYPEVDLKKFKLTKEVFSEDANYKYRFLTYDLSPSNT